MSPLTGWRRSGYCDFEANDVGIHTVCAQMTDVIFLEFEFAINFLYFLTIEKLISYCCY